MTENQPPYVLVVDDDGANRYAVSRTLRQAGYVVSEVSGGQEVPEQIDRHEFDLLLYLAAHRGRIVSCHELVREVRGYAVAESEARGVIRPHVSNLRGKLKGMGVDADLLVNARGIGYRLSEAADFPV